MVKEKISLKKEIKELAKEIKETKAAHKAAQQSYSLQWTKAEFNSLTWYKNPEKYHTIEPTLRTINETRNELEGLKHHFRIKHIVHSMCKGRTISQIESRVSNLDQDRYERENVYRVAKNILSEMGKEWLE